MALKIRLRRMGRKKAPHYRIVIAESTMPRDGRFVATIGHYNPTTRPETLKVDNVKAAAWLAKGAVPTDTVRSLFRKAGVGKETGVVETVTSAVADAAATAGKAARGAASKAAGAARDVAAKVADVAGDAASKVADVAGDAASKVADVAGDAASAVAGAASSVVETVKDAAGAVADKVTGGDEAEAAAPPAAEAETETETEAAPADEAVTTTVNPQITDEVAPAAGAEAHVEGDEPANS